MAIHLYCRCGAVYDHSKLDPEKLYKCKECESILSPDDAVDTQELELLQKAAMPKSGTFISVVFIVALALLGIAIGVAKVSAKSAEKQKDFDKKVEAKQGLLDEWEKKSAAIKIEDKTDEKAKKYMEKVFDRIVAARKKVYPAVVSISNLTNQGGGTGSGAIFQPTANVSSDETYIVSNYHVVADAKILEVTLSNQETVFAKIIHDDDFCDVAVIKLTDSTKAKGIKPAKFGDSDKVRVGDYCMAMGAPQGLGRSLAFGIIVATNKYIPTMLGNHISHQEHQFFQTDASINHGNSGGPLVSLRGEIIGMNTLALTHLQRIGYSIASNYEQEIANEIIKNDKLSRQPLVERSTYGMTFLPLSAIGCQEKNGILVGSVESGSPAYSVGIRPGDVITKANGSPVSARFYNDIAKVNYIFQKVKLGTTMSVTWKDMLTGQEKSGDMTSTAIPANTQSTTNVGQFLFGAIISPAFVANYEALGLENQEDGGFQIHAWTDSVSFLAGGPVFRLNAMGIQCGDIIMAVDGAQPRHVIEIYRRMYNKYMTNLLTGTDDPSILTIARGNSIIHLQVLPK